jgi:hypothetical protein
MSMAPIWPTAPAVMQPQALEQHSDESQRLRSEGSAEKLLSAPELVARTWAAAKRESQDEITEREVTVLLADFATVWSELFPAEQARIVQLLVERVHAQEDALEVWVRAAGLASLVDELRQQGKRMAA